MSEIKDYILKQKDLFTDVQKTKTDGLASSSRIGKHSVLNYPKLVEDMIKYLAGFKDYKMKSEKSFKHKVLSSTYSFYNDMFTLDKYRKTISLSEFSELNYKFIEKTKELQSVLSDLSKSVDNEVRNIVEVSEKQYKKIGKVNRDDMLTYMWLVGNVPISQQLKAYYNDPQTPVMHKANTKIKE